jgi:uncharacterized membrane protein
LNYCKIYIKQFFFTVFCVEHGVTTVKITDVPEQLPASFLMAGHSNSATPKSVYNEYASTVKISRLIAKNLLSYASGII